MPHKLKPAICGGDPIRDTYLPYGKQWIEEDDIDAVVQILKSDYLTTGPMVSLFEEELAREVGAKYAVAFSSGTAALHGACFAAGIGPGDEVITTPLTFAASANCILYQGGTPVFADVDPRTYNIDPASIFPLVHDKTKALIPVDYTGQPVNYEAIQQIARQYGLIVIEDAAHALGASYKDHKIGALSDMTMFSLHPVKHITSGEGGIITTDDPDLYDKLQQFRSHGITRNKRKMLEHHGPWYYEMHWLGYNYRLTDIQAALGLSQLKKMDRFMERREEIVQRYNEAFAKMNSIQTPYQAPEGRSSWHLYVIKLCKEQLSVGRKEIFLALQQENIGVQVHYIPVHTMPFYRKLGYGYGLCPIAESLYQDILTLPLFPKMTDQDVQDVINAVNKVVEYYSR